MTPKALEKLRLEAARLMGVEADFSRQRARKLERAEGVDLGAETLEATLAGDDKAATRAAAKAAKASAEAEALASAIVAARRVRGVAILAAWRAEAELKGQDAETLRVTAGSLQVKIDDLLARVEAESGVKYVPGPRQEYAGVGLTRMLAYGVDASPTQVDILRGRAVALDAEAAALEAREVSHAGSASGADLAGLFTAVAADPFRIGPTLAELSAWALTAEQAARSAWQAVRWREHEDASDAAWGAVGKTFTTMWRVGQIVPGESSCVVARGVMREDPSWVPGTETPVSYAR